MCPKDAEGMANGVDLDQTRSSLFRLEIEHWLQKLAASRQNQQNDLCAQRRLRSAWASAQSDQSPRCALNG